MLTVLLQVWFPFTISRIAAFRPLTEFGYGPNERFSKIIRFLEPKFDNQDQEHLSKHRKREEHENWNAINLRVVHKGNDLHPQGVDID